MNFPHSIVVLRSTAVDAYGNYGTNFTDPTELPTKGFEVVPGALLLLPKTADVLQGDRFRIGDETYGGEVQAISSPSALKLYQVRLARVED
ncbi:hypothetical protein [Kribbella sp. CA-293567]|uniref:hypothetical protein n=1 Tax=Kribbella sp. CA-293567 TaxID=3002436 RepID=UPI0022DD11B0|nr:hypothetical protein [Kribbella sp. CA-293567]WBQ03784.1 hypothetical protein OX958_27920 [Kribbella sp. CA-293567]